MEKHRFISFMIQKKIYPLIVLKFAKVNHSTSSGIFLIPQLMTAATSAQGFNIII